MIAVAMTSADLPRPQPSSVGPSRRRCRRSMAHQASRGRGLAARGVAGELSRCLRSDRSGRSAAGAGITISLSTIAVRIVDAGRFERRPKAVVRPVAGHPVQQPHHRRFAQGAVRRRERQHRLRRGGILDERQRVERQPAVGERQLSRRCARAVRSVTDAGTCRRHAIQVKFAGQASGSPLTPRSAAADRRAPAPCRSHRSPAPRDSCDPCRRSRAPRRPGCSATCPPAGRAATPRLRGARQGRCPWRVARPSAKMSRFARRIARYAAMRSAGSVNDSGVPARSVLRARSDRAGRSPGPACTGWDP